MKHRGVVVAMLLASPAALRAQATVGPPWDSIGTLLGASASANAGTFRFNFPRRDLSVRLGDVAIEPALALTSWAAFGVLGPDTIVMGDVVATAAELKPVLRSFAHENIDVAAIHNHLGGETPAVIYVHFMATGSAVDLARRLRRILAATAVPLPARSVPAPGPPVDSAAAFSALGVRGRVNGPLAQFSFDLVPGDVTLHGHILPRPLGVFSPLNIFALSSSRWVATGDFTVVGGRVDPVLDALARNDIAATAVHSHMVGESPALYYIHFWADGAPAQILRGLRAALDAGKITR